MERYRTAVISALVVGLVLFAAGFLLGKQTRSNTSKSEVGAFGLPDGSVMEGQWQEWSERVETNIGERDTIVAGLKRIAADENR